MIDKRYLLKYGMDSEGFEVLLIGLASETTSFK